MKKKREGKIFSGQTRTKIWVESILYNRKIAPSLFGLANTKTLFSRQTAPANQYHSRKWHSIGLAEVSRRGKSLLGGQPKTGYRINGGSGTGAEVTQTTHCLLHSKQTRYSAYPLSLGRESVRDKWLPADLEVSSASADRSRETELFPAGTMKMI